MADVEMADASASTEKPKAVVKASKGGAVEGGDSKKRFEVKKVRAYLRLTYIYVVLTVLFQWNAVALWAWDIVVDNCAICRNHIMDLCNYLPRSHPRVRISNQVFRH